MTVLVTLDDHFSVEHIDFAKGALPAQARNLEEIPIAAAGLELKRAIRRLAGQSQEMMEKRLQRLLRSWLRARRGVAILQEVGVRPSPRLFVDRVGSNVADVSWEMLGGESRAAFFELALLGYASHSHRMADPQLQKLGTFAAPGGNQARSYRFVRLESVRWHRARVRAVGPERSWVSDWSNEVSFRTMSVADAKGAGLHVASEGFLVKSERLIQKCATDQDLALPAREALQVMQVRQILGTPQSYQAVTQKLLNARHSKGGWPDFVKQGARFSRPAALREERLKRMQLAIAAEELYGLVYPQTNEWCQGPFYYESAGLKMLRRSTA